MVGLPNSFYLTLFVASLLLANLSALSRLELVSKPGDN